MFSDLILSNTDIFISYKPGVFVSGYFSKIRSFEFKGAICTIHNPPLYIRDTKVKMQLLKPAGCALPRDGYTLTSEAYRHEEKILPWGRDFANGIKVTGWGRGNSSCTQALARWGQPQGEVQGCEALGSSFLPLLTQAERVVGEAEHPPSLSSPWLLLRLRGEADFCVLCRCCSEEPKGPCHNGLAAIKSQDSRNEPIGLLFHHDFIRRHKQDTGFISKDNEGLWVNIDPDPDLMSILDMFI